MDKLLNLPYFGSVYHWAQLFRQGNNIIEAHGNYLRRTFRNRVVIMSANGPIALTVPVFSSNDAPYVQTRINYSTDWASEHLNAFRSAYNASPFYEFYEDDFAAIYQRNNVFLWQLNLDMMQLIAQLLQIELNVTFTAEYEKQPSQVLDLRNGIGHNSNHLLAQDVIDVAYYQVFAQKYGFQKGMSVLDLLFNMGPEAKLVLMQMARGE